MIFSPSTFRPNIRVLCLPALFFQGVSGCAGSVFSLKTSRVCSDIEPVCLFLRGRYRTLEVFGVAILPGSISGKSKRIIAEPHGTTTPDGEVAPVSRGNRYKIHPCSTRWAEIDSHALQASRQ